MNNHPLMPYNNKNNNSGGKTLLFIYLFILQISNIVKLQNVTTHGSRALTTAEEWDIPFVYNIFAASRLVVQFVLAAQLFSPWCCSASCVLLVSVQAAPTAAVTDAEGLREAVGSCRAVNTHWQTMQTAPSTLWPKACHIWPACCCAASLSAKVSCRPLAQLQLPSRDAQDDKVKLTVKQQFTKRQITTKPVRSADNNTV